MAFGDDVLFLSSNEAAWSLLSHLGCCVFTTCRERGIGADPLPAV